MEGNSDVAERVDRDLGIVERAAFIGGPRRMLAITHLPMETPTAGVVICPSILVDRVKAYRVEVELARSLAAQGVAVQRFHYRGFDQSDGDPLDATFDRMLEDADTARHHLRDEWSVGPLAYVGFRWGALMATSLAASDIDPAASAKPPSLVLWDPVGRPAEFFRASSRAHRVKELARGDAAPSTSSGSLKEQLASKGMADILGFTIGKSLVESSADRDLAGELGDRSVSVLVFHGAEGPSPSAKKVLDTWQEQGMDITSREMPSQDSDWWFLADSSRAFRADSAVREASAWIVPRLVKVDAL